MMNLQVVSFVATIELASCLSIIDLTVLEKQKKERDHECVRALENIREENFSKLLTRDRLLRTFTPSRDAWIDKATRSHKTKIVSLKHQHQTYND